MPRIAMESPDLPEGEGQDLGGAPAFGATTTTTSRSVSRTSSFGSSSSGFGSSSGSGFGSSTGSSFGSSNNNSAAASTAAAGAESTVALDKDAQDWVNKKWRPMMGWVYMGTCTFDFVIAPILWSLIQVLGAGKVEMQWQPITLQGAGLYHIAMGAVLGIAAYGRTKEKLEAKQ